MEKRTLFRKKRQIPLWNLVWEFTFRKTTVLFFTVIDILWQTR